uniref:cytochrome b n=1 Tax=Cyphocaris challengeri TaxID=3018532 RepID=UPI0022FDABD7|nr:cytochrome b [Cyphocaris challengeri]WBQ48840.1 cytochrome b [Cyphocaris challengeri]
MKFYPHKSMALTKIFKSTLIILPAPKNISLMWNLGSLLSLCLIIQIISGLMIAISYTTDLSYSFIITSKTMYIKEHTWFMRFIHANGASMFFMFLYIHTARGLYFMSYELNHTWNIGVTILLLTMAAAFLGYALPVNQMSFWGASVITSLFSEIPYVGLNIVNLIWGGFSVSSLTIMRFFTFHFILPFIILALVALHITLLHETGSTSPMKKKTLNKLAFNPFFALKDLTGVIISLTLFMWLVLYYPIILGDTDNFNPANPSVTPHHIQPEWYFLFAYAILRSVPNKLGGVIALVLAVVILYLPPNLPSTKMKGMTFYPMNTSLFWFFIFTVALLTWIGAHSVEPPYTVTGQIISALYFFYFLVFRLTLNIKS